MLLPNAPWMCCKCSQPFNFIHTVPINLTPLGVPLPKRALLSSGNPGSIFVFRCLLAETRLWVLHAPGPGGDHRDPRRSLYRQIHHNGTRQYLLNVTKNSLRCLLLYLSETYQSREPMIRHYSIGWRRNFCVNSSWVTYSNVYYLK